MGRVSWELNQGVAARPRRPALEPRRGLFHLPHPAEALPHHSGHLTRWSHRLPTCELATEAGGWWSGGRSTGRGDASGCSYRTGLNSLAMEELPGEDASMAGAEAGGGGRERGGRAGWLGGVSLGRLAIHQSPITFAEHAEGLGGTEGHPQRLHQAVACCIMLPKSWGGSAGPPPHSLQSQQQHREGDRLHAARSLTWPRSAAGSRLPGDPTRVDRRPAADGGP